MRDRLLMIWRRYRSPIRVALSIVGLISVPYIIWVNRFIPTIFGFDAYTTWTIDFNNLYGIQYLDLGAFRYTPAYAEIFQWVHALPWEVFLWIWDGILLAIMFKWARSWTLALLAIPPVALELYHGNIHVFMAAAMVVGFRYPAAWIFPMISKVTPGLAVVWFLGRRQWRNFAIAVGSTAVVCAISFVIAPRYWFDWVTTMRQAIDFRPETPYPVDIPFLYRAVFAAGLALWGGVTNRRWTVPVAGMIALPIIWWHSFSMLLAVIPLLRQTRTVDQYRSAEPSTPPASAMARP
jgi:hypothetical protein